MSNIWDQTLAHSRCVHATQSSYAAMKECIRQNNIEGFKILFSRIHESKHLDENTYQSLMQTAARNGSVGCFTLLEPYVAEPLVYSDALNTAAEKGHVMLVQHIEPMVDDYSKEEALCMAVLYNRTEVVDHLLPLCDPKNQSSKCLAAAASGGHWELFERLYAVCDPHAALRYMQCKFVDAPHEWHMLEQRILRDALIEAAAAGIERKPSKM